MTKKRVFLIIVPNIATSDSGVFVSDIKDLFSSVSIDLTDLQEEQFSVYRSFLKEYNEKVNLTAITDDREIVVKHFIDSALGEKLIPRCATVVDVGSGAGFPALPIKILRPDVRFTLLDSLGKRIVFLEEAVQKLSLTDIECKHLRAEEGAKLYREHFDCAVARAVAALPTLLEYTLPLVRVGGVFIAYKSGNVEEELSSAKNALTQLGGKVVGKERFSLPDGSERTLLTFKKIAPTPPRFPRPQNKPRLSPL